MSKNIFCGNVISFLIDFAQMFRNYYSEYHTVKGDKIFSSQDLHSISTSAGKVHKKIHYIKDSLLIVLVREPLFFLI